METYIYTFQNRIFLTYNYLQNLLPLLQMCPKCLQKCLTLHQHLSATYFRNTLYMGKEVKEETRQSKDGEEG